MNATLPEDLQARQEQVTAARKAALDALRDAEKAQQELNAEIRERTR